MLHSCSYLPRSGKDSCGFYGSQRLVFLTEASTCCFIHLLFGSLFMDFDFLTCVYGVNTSRLVLIHRGLTVLIRHPPKCQAMHLHALRQYFSYVA